MPRDSRVAPRGAAAMPLPSEDTTPPVTKTYLAMKTAAAGKPDDSRIRLKAQRTQELPADFGELGGARPAQPLEGHHLAGNEFDAVPAQPLQRQCLVLRAARGHRLGDDEHLLA